MELPAGHEAFDELAALSAVGALSEHEQARLDAHVAECARCAAEVRRLTAIAAALGESSAPAAPAPHVKAAILARIAADVPGTGRPQPRRRIATWLAAAASLALAAAIAGYAVSVRRAAPADRLVGAVLAAPDLARIDLAGQPVAPSASARAFWSRSRGLVMTASNLPALPKGRVYQLWILTADPAPLSAGLLRPRQDGGVTAAFNTPVDMPAPVAMAVTLEPDGGVPAPTGDKFLVGQLEVQ